MSEWEVRAFAPGRVELAGNHLDHQGGRVVSAAVTQGTEVLARPNDDGVVRLRSKGYMPFTISVASETDLQPHLDEAGTSAGLVRGMVAGLAAAGVAPRGFDAQVSTTLPPGGGLSSSASFEMAIGRAIEALAGANPLPPLQLAAIGARAEQDFFGKPCGLQDQSASACGGISLLDFAQPDAPTATPIAFDFEEHGHAVVLVDTRCDHSQFTADFAKVVDDMVAAAGFFGAARLGEVPGDTYVARIRDIARKLGDGVALRGFHYFNELHLVDERVEALRLGDIDAYLQATRRSAASSAQYLQNVAVPGSSQQPAMLALALADRLLDGRGACRIHGGGFGGTIQAYVPLDMLERFVAGIEGTLGRGVCNVVTISNRGAWAERL
ncbi:MAG: galactokinase family protein [Coriobacteriia bacterium]|nr:galactokinase family protein [Coriobacteriia bacterium]